MFVWTMKFPTVERIQGHMDENVRRKDKDRKKMPWYKRLGRSSSMYDSLATGDASNFGLSTSVSSSTQQQNPVADETESNVTIYQPESMEHLLSVTKFTRRELKVMYRGFKQACPSGYISIDHFKEIFSMIFPHGDSSSYATLVFRAIGESPDSKMTFTDIALVLSTLSRGSPIEKLEWTFKLYDIDKDGCVGMSEMLAVFSSVHDLMGPHTDPPPDQFYVKTRAKEVFQALDTNGTGAVTRQQFVQACLEDRFLRQSLDVFNTVL